VKEIIRLEAKIFVAGGKRSLVKSGYPSDFDFLHECFSFSCIFINQ
jgi:hypothetical protein